MKKEWKVVDKFPDYMISNYGEVKSSKFLKKRGVWHLLKQGTNKNTKYRMVYLTHNGVRKTLHVHRLVALAFIPNPKNKPCVNHKKANKKEQQGK